MEFAIVALIMVFILTYSGAVDTKKLYEDNKGAFAFIKEKDYDF